MLSFFPRGVLDEILNLIESVFEGFPSYSHNGTDLIYNNDHSKYKTFHTQFTVDRVNTKYAIFDFCYTQQKRK